MFLQKQFPNFFAGIELAELENGRLLLKDVIPLLLKIPKDLQFYFHANEAGSSSDEDLIDSILLGSKRIGHSLTILNHPTIMELVKENNVALEVCPVANQILQRVTDIRKHPCCHLFADNYPVVISSDRPSLWKCTPLSHDFYVAFVSFASDHSDLRFLKKLAINSLRFSAMSSEEMEEGFAKWQTSWDKFIECVIDYDSSVPRNELVIIDELLKVIDSSCV